MNWKALASHRNQLKGRCNKHGKDRYQATDPNVNNTVTKTIIRKRHKSSEK